MSGGNGLSFPVFNINIYKEADPVGTIMECAWFLRTTDLMDTRKSWKKFGNSFFEHYQPVILDYFGYEPEVLAFPKIKVTDSQLFIAVMKALQKTGMFECPAKEVAEMLHAAFDLELQLSSVIQGLYDPLLEYEEVLNFFKDYRKYDF